MKLPFFLYRSGPGKGGLDYYAHDKAVRKRLEASLCAKKTTKVHKDDSIVTDSASSQWTFSGEPPSSIEASTKHVVFAVSSDRGAAGKTAQMRRMDRNVTPANAARRLACRQKLHHAVVASVWCAAVQRRAGTHVQMRAAVRAAAEEAAAKKPPVAEADAKMPAAAAAPPAAAAAQSAGAKRAAAAAARQGGKHTQIEHFVVDEGRALGSGGCGTVYLARDYSVEPPVPCAAKLVRLRPGTSDEKYAAREVQILQRAAGHEGVVGLRGHAMVTGKAWLFMEYATGGELIDLLFNEAGEPRRLPEGAVRRYGRALVSAVAHCHTAGVVHRDIKLENLMLCAEDPDALLLIDFGLAACVSVGADGCPATDRLFDAVGTRSYKAPELARASEDGYVGAPVDVWSMGVVLFSLATGFFPFYEAKRTDCRFEYVMRDQRKGVGACASLFALNRLENNLSPGLQALLDSMLTVDPRKRPSLQELSVNDWLHPPPSDTTSEVAKPPHDDGDDDDDDDDDYGADGACVYRGLLVDDVAEKELEPLGLPAEELRIARHVGCRGDESRSE